LPCHFDVIANKPVAISRIFIYDRLSYNTCHWKSDLTNHILVSSRPEKETSEDSDSSPPYLPAQPSAPEELEHGYVRDVAV